jgi:ELWxxDGT repeat protein
MLSFTALGNRVYFSGHDELHGFELWTSDGTAEGTHMVKDIYPGPMGTVEDIYPRFARLGKELYFSASDGVHGQELWKTDGTAEGTVLAPPHWPGVRGLMGFRLDPVLRELLIGPDRVSVEAAGGQAHE